MMSRIYSFGDNEHKIEVANGGYLSADRIKHYEDVFGKLNSVSYGNITVMAERRGNYI